MWKVVEEMGVFSKVMGVPLYYYSQPWHRNYSDMRITSVAQYSVFEDIEKFVDPCCDPEHALTHQSYMPYIFDFAMLEN